MHFYGLSAPSNSLSLLSSPLSTSTSSLPSLSLSRLPFPSLLLLTLLHHPFLLHISFPPCSPPPSISPSLFPLFPSFLLPPLLYLTLPSTTPTTLPAAPLSQPAASPRLQYTSPGERQGVPSLGAFASPFALPALTQGRGCSLAHLRHNPLLSLGLGNAYAKPTIFSADQKNVF